MSFFSEKPTKLIDNDDPDDVFADLDNLDFETDTVYSGLLSSSPAPGHAPSPANVRGRAECDSSFANSSAAPVQQLPSHEAPSQAKRSPEDILQKRPMPSATQAPLTKKLQSNSVPLESRKELSFSKIDFRIPPTKSSRLTPVSKLQATGNDVPPKLKEEMNETLLDSQLDAPKPAVVSPAPISTASPAPEPDLSPTQQRTVRPVFTTSIDVVRESSHTEARVRGIQKGLDDMATMYRSTIRQRLGRDREELALLGTRVLESDPIHELAARLVRLKDKLVPEEGEVAADSATNENG